MGVTKKDFKLICLSIRFDLKNNHVWCEFSPNKINGLDATTINVISKKHSFGFRGLKMNISNKNSKSLFCTSTSPYFFYSTLLWESKSKFYYYLVIPTIRSDIATSSYITSFTQTITIIWLDFFYLYYLYKFHFMLCTQ